MYKKTNSKKFTEARNKMPQTLAVFLTEYSAKDYKDMSAACYISKDEKSGYAIKIDGDLISVFSLPGAKHGIAAIKNAIENGAIKLDCIGNFLATLYSKFGFVEYKREAWNDDYAPVNWDYEKFGKPDIIYMKLE